jgi:hypothetical protein
MERFRTTSSPDPDCLDAGPSWIIELSRSGSESYGRWWYGGGESPSPRRLASTRQRAFRFHTRATAEWLAQTFRDAGDADVEVLEVHDL